MYILDFWEVLDIKEIIYQENDFLYPWREEKSDLKFVRLFQSVDLLVGWYMFACVMTRNLSASKNY